MLLGFARRFAAAIFLPMSTAAETAGSSSSSSSHQNGPAAAALLYDSFAEQYAEHIVRTTMLHATDLIGLAEAPIRSARRILELGCGTGAFGLAYQQKFPHGIDGQTIVCTDLSPAMVETAERLMTKSSATTSSATTFRFQVADATNLSDFADDSFDAIVSVFGIFLIPDRDAMLSEVRRVLKPGGTLITSAWTSTSYNAELQARGFGCNLHDAMAALRPSQPPDNTGTNNASATPTTTTAAAAAASMKEQPKLPPFILDWFDRENISTMLRANNYFSEVSIGRAIHTNTYANVEHVFTTFTSTSPHSAAALLSNPDQVQQTKRALAALVAPDGNVNDPLCIFSVSNLVVAS
jgi:ubiquinone/menaquinone biosynthesis C-methylase UbiE